MLSKAVRVQNKSLISAAVSIVMFLFFFDVACTSDWLIWMRYAASKLIWINGWWRNNWQCYTLYWSASLGTFLCAITLKFGIKWHKKSTIVYSIELFTFLIITFYHSPEASGVVQCKIMSQVEAEWNFFRLLILKHYLMEAISFLYQYVYQKTFRIQSPSETK